MFNKKEILIILITSVVIAFSVNLFISGYIAFLWTLLAVFCVIAINVLAKKISGFFLETETEIKFWEIEGYGLRKRRHFKKPFAIGAFLPLVSKIILFPINGLAWMGSLMFEVKPSSYRAARRHGLYTFSEMTEEHIGYIAAAGIFMNLIFAVIGYLLGFTEFSRLNIYYAFFNMIPISHLDGNKIFFGNIILWSFLACLVVAGLFSIIFIV
jgi:Zn-dependent protease